jgi:hypothetical protein
MTDERRDPVPDEAAPEGTATDEAAPEGTATDEAAEDPKEKRFGNGAEERHGDEADADAEAEEASKDSFPSSDPPSW